jgi:uncharacterized membrane protein YccC
MAGSEERFRFQLPAGIRSPGRSARAAALVGGAYAVEVVICITALRWGYAIVGSGGALWAIVSAVVVLQPGVRQSLLVASQRILANLIGACVGFVWTGLLGAGSWQTPLGIVAVVAICQALRLEQSLRAACVALLIVTTTGDGNLASTSLSRFLAVLVGSAVALGVQSLIDTLAQGWLARLAGSPESSTPAEAATTPREND